jgi:hypothetical protein
MMACLGDDGKRCFQAFPSRFYKLVVCVRPLSTGLPLCGSTGMLLFKIPDRKSVLLSGMGKVPVGVDVLCVGGGVFFFFGKTVWVRFLVLDDYLVIGGVYLVFFFA